MRLRTRLTVAVATVSTLGTLILGGLVVTEGQNARVNTIDRQLLAVATRVAENPDDPIAAGMLAVDRSPTALALGFHAKGAGFTWLREAGDVIVAVPDDATLARGLQGPTDAGDGSRITTIRLKDGATLVVAAPTEDLVRQTGTDIAWLALFWVVLNLLMGVLIRVLVRRDTHDIERLVALAEQVAAGGEVRELPVRARSAEMATLADALRTMVQSLRSAVLTEQAANQRMQAFLGDASHELRTPLTVIKGYLELLERDVTPEQRERALLRMRSEAARMQVLVNDLLLLAEIGGPAPERVEPVDLSALVLSLLDDLVVLQPERPVEADVLPDVEVLAVPEHLHRAVGNAFANVRRHTAADASVRVLLRWLDAGALLVIEDGGPGLSEDMYERGIAHFQRFDRSRSRATGGSGLGMSIIAAVMEELEGSVTLRRSELGGLRLEFRFPVARPAGAA